MLIEVLDKKVGMRCSEFPGDEDHTTQIETEDEISEHISHASLMYGSRTWLDEMDRRFF